MADQDWRSDLLMCPASKPPYIPDFHSLQANTEFLFCDKKLSQRKEEKANHDILTVTKRSHRKGDQHSHTPWRYLVQIPAQEWINSMHQPVCPHASRFHNSASGGQITGNSIFFNTRLLATFLAWKCPIQSRNTVNRSGFEPRTLRQLGHLLPLSYRGSPAQFSN